MFHEFRDKPVRILIIEDDSIREHLESEYYTVDVVSDGETGSEQAYVEDYDLIILDIMLPGKDGFTVLRELRQSEKSTPV
ncbi:MAG: response regulator [bacterium]